MLPSYVRKEMREDELKAIMEYRNCSHEKAERILEFEKGNDQEGDN